MNIRLNTTYKRALLATILLALSLSAAAEEWSLKDDAGVRHTLSGLHGKWVLVNFWAPWCPPCLQEMPEFVSLQKRRDLQVIGVAVMYKTRTEVTNMVQKQAISYPIVLGNEDIAGDFGGIAGLPTSLLYSPTGQLVGRHEGPLTREQIEQSMEGKPTTLFVR